MSSDGKGTRKLRLRLCAKCGDRGEMNVFIRSKGRVSGYRVVPCPKNCQAAQRKQAAANAKTG